MLFRTPGVVNNYLEKLRARFFWGQEEDIRELHWVKWDCVMASKEKGGLDIGSLDAFNKAFLFKWKWEFLKNKALWCKVLKGVHGRDGDLGWCVDSC